MVRGCPPCCRVGRLDELGRHLACRTERRIVEDGEIFLDSASRCLGWQPRGAFDAVAVTGVRLDQAGVDSKAFATDQTLSKAALQYALSRKRPWRFFEKVERSGTAPSSPSRQNHR